MARPRKCKHVCGLPRVNEFVSPDSAVADPIVMTVEEYEVIRLIDQEDLTQEECAVRMEVSRPTVQILYNNARRKLADFLVDGGKLQIQGGDYRICGDTRPGCGLKCCHRHDRRCEHQK